MKGILLFCFLACCLQPSHSQVRMGVKGGLLFNMHRFSEKDLYGKTDGAVKTVTHYHAGIAADIPLIAQLHLRPDLYYTKKSGKRNWNPQPGVFRAIDFNAEYIELPVHFSWQLKLKKADIYFGAGPYAAFALSGKYTTGLELRSDEGLVGQITRMVHTTDQWYRKLDLGAGIVAGCDLPFGLTGELHFRRGFTNMYDPEYQSGNTKIYNFTGGISLGYYFNVRKL